MKFRFIYIFNALIGTKKHMYGNHNIDLDKIYGITSFKFYQYQIIKNNLTCIDDTKLYNYVKGTLFFFVVFQ